MKDEARYIPCRAGVHVCGANHDANQFFTEANFPGVTFKQFCAAKIECEDPSQPKDFVVDFMKGDDVVEDFWISRQMLPRLAIVLTGTTSYSR